MIDSSIDLTNSITWFSWDIHDMIVMSYNLKCKCLLDSKWR